jgi:hypothetical protein
MCCNAIEHEGICDEIAEIAACFHGHCYGFVRIDDTQFIVHNGCSAEGRKSSSVRGQ